MTSKRILKKHFRYVYYGVLWRNYFPFFEKKKTKRWKSQILFFLLEVKIEYEII